MDKYLQLANFHFGLDSRRAQLTSQPGTLQTLTNAHINPGGEIEKRKAFVRLNTDATRFPSWVYGLQDSEDGLLAFGDRPLIGETISRSRTANVASLTMSRPHHLTVGDLVTVASMTDATFNAVAAAVLSTTGNTSFTYANVGANVVGAGDTAGRVTYTTTMPPGVTYVPLVYPRDIYDPLILNIISMTEVTFSLNFNGKAFVAAKFSDGVHILYYDGAPVYQSQNGMVIAGHADLAAQATELTAEINRIENGWTAAVGTSTYDTASVLIKSPAGTSLSVVITKDTLAGTLGDVLVDHGSAGTSGIQATASFKVNVNGTVGVDTWTITAPATAAGTGTFDLMNGAVASDANANATAALLAATINANTNVTGYSASAATNNVFVYAPLSFGAFTFNLTVVTTGAAATAASTGGSTLALTLNTTFLENTVLGHSGNRSVGSGTVIASATGGTTPYTFFTWTETNADGTAVTTPSGIIINPGIPSPNSSQRTFQKTNMTLNTTVTGYFKCVVTDTAAGTATSPVLTVQLSYETDL